MALIGITRKSNYCKICISFNEETLNEITLDILFNRRTYKEIMAHYTPLLPDKVPALNAMNINNHRKHSDPALIAEDVLKKKGKAMNPSDIVSQLYSERFKAVIDKQTLLQETYKERLNNLCYLQALVTEKQLLLDVMKGEKKAENAVMINSLEGKIIEDVIKIDDILESIQTVVIKDTNADKGIGEGNVYITQNFVNVFQNHLKGFMDEIIPHILLDYFATSPDKGKKLILFLSQAMDKHLQPAFLETKMIGDSTIKPS